MGTRCYTFTGCYTYYSVISYRSVTSCYGEQMKKILITVALFIAISYMPITSLGFTFPSGQPIPTGTDLISACEKDAPWAMWCTGYLMGMFHQITVSNAVDKENKFLPCLPAGITAGQIEKMLTNYLNDNPEKSHMPAFTLINGILMNAYPPCSK
jgi:hypothetical protein